MSECGHGTRAECGARQKAVIGPEQLDLPFSHRLPPSSTMNSCAGHLPRRTEALPRRIAHSGAPMEFVSLHAVLLAISECINAEHTVGSAEFKRSRQVSEAARNLLQQWNNAEDPRPRWVEMDSNIRRLMFKQSVAVEGVVLLEKAAAWNDDETARRLAFLVAKERSPQSCPIEPVVAENGQWDDREFLRALNVGFDRPEVIRFLDATNLSHRLHPAKTRLEEAAVHPDVIDVTRGLTSPEIAEAFATLSGWTKGKWEKRLGDVKRIVWLQEALIEAGHAGRDSAIWDPVKLALGLQKRNKRRVPWQQLETVFDRPDLRPWIEKWKRGRQEYEKKHGSNTWHSPANPHKY
jgi:hypothetical protein